MLVFRGVPFPVITWFPSLWTPDLAYYREGGTTHLRLVLLWGAQLSVSIQIPCLMLASQSCITKDIGDILCKSWFTGEIDIVFELACTYLRFSKTQLYASYARKASSSGPQTLLTLTPLISVRRFSLRQPVVWCVLTMFEFGLRAYSPTIRFDNAASMLRKAGRGNQLQYYEKSHVWLGGLMIVNFLIALANQEIVW